MGWYRISGTDDKSLPQGNERYSSHFECNCDLNQAAGAADAIACSKGSQSGGVKEREFR
jgi:hypothetical protein